VCLGFRKGGAVRLDRKAFGAAMGLAWAAIVFVATLWVTYKGSGEHLLLLARFYPAYSLGFVGAVIGAFWAFLHGLATGWILAWLYNRLAAA
jgi:hypothetical protein